MRISKVLSLGFSLFLFGELELMERNPLISVIIPTYNRRYFLEKISVPSVLRQTYSNFELIIVDDHSVDNTADVVKSLSKRDKRIKYLKNFRKKGASGARNSGILVSKGKYISFLDDDDEWVPEHLERLCFYLEKYKSFVDIIGAAQIHVDFKTKKLVHSVYFDRYKNFNGYFLGDVYFFTDNLFSAALKTLIIPHCAMLVKRSVFDYVLYPEDISICEDCFFLMKVVYLGFKLAFLPKVHLICYIHSHNSSCVSQENQPEKIIEVGRQLLAFCNKCLSSFSLNYSQKKYLKKKISDIYCWRVAYNGYLRLNDYNSFIKFFWLGLRYDPLSVSKWKTFLKHLLFYKFKKLKGHNI